VRIWDLEAPLDGESAGPRVLFSTPEARAVVADLAAGEEFGEHHVRERAMLLVLHGTAEVTRQGEAVMVAGGAMVVYEPGELHSIRALEPTRAVLIFAPWPGVGHYDAAEREDPHELPARATALESGSQ
jgi:quercetin dioxygenase-like cupin family protein